MQDLAVITGGQLINEEVNIAFTLARPLTLFLVAGPGFHEQVGPKLLEVVAENLGSVKKVLPRHMLCACLSWQI